MLFDVQDVRDYRIHASSEQQVIAGGSAFNVKAGSLRLGDFTETEVRSLQHTGETGQEFAPEALDAVWEQTRGQPCLVNALAKEMCFEHEELRLRDPAISESAVYDAREALILRCETHLDQLADKLREPEPRQAAGHLSGPLAGELGALGGEGPTPDIWSSSMCGPGRAGRTGSPGKNG